MSVAALIQNANYNCVKSVGDRARLIACEKLTHRQIETLEAARSSSGGWINRGTSRIWGTAPNAIRALARKGFLAMHKNGDRARLTPAGRALAERLRSESRS